MEPRDQITSEVDFYSHPQCWMEESLWIDEQTLALQQAEAFTPLQAHTVQYILWLRPDAPGNNPQVPHDKVVILLQI